MTSPEPMPLPGQPGGPPVPQPIDVPTVATTEVPVVPAAPVAVPLAAGLTIVHDAIAANISALPAGPAAGYTTGSSDIVWTAEDWKNHPGAVRIDQDPNASDPTADVLDVENGAATPADAPKWISAARKDITAQTRPGQRTLPLIYQSQDNVTTVVNALISSGIQHNVGLFVADFSLTQTEAEALVTSAGGPFPIKAVQFESGPTFDTSVFNSDWLASVVEAAGWVLLNGIPKNSPVFYNKTHGTIGYTDTGGHWVKVQLP
jgi:hypothetical protein